LVGVEDGMQMIQRIIMIIWQETILMKSKGSVAMREENMRTLRGAVEISKLVSKNRYDESSKYSRLKFLIHEIHNAYF
jgi:hypothetical protein